MSVLSVPAHRFRDNLSHYAELAEEGVDVIVTKRGKPKFRLAAISDEKPCENNALADSCGMWADREDMSDPVQYVRSMRKGRAF